MRTSIVGILVFFLVAPSASASVLQDGYGPDVPGVAPGDGPREDEVAFIRELPGSAVPNSAPLLRDGKVYVLTSGHVVGDRVRPTNSQATRPGCSNSSRRSGF